MNTDTLDLPPIIGDEPTAAAAVAPVSTSTAPKVTVRDAALQPLNALAPGLRAVTERYRAVAFDLKTPKGLQAAKDARHDLRKNGRFLVQNTRDELKGLLNDAKTAVEAKAVELIAITQPREDELDKDIEAREAEVKAEKAEAARILAERQRKQADGVAGIRAYLSRAQTAADMTAERVGKGIALLEAMTFSADEWLDPVAAASAQCETLEGMRVLQSTLKTREEAAAAAEAQRLENERVAAELAAAQAKLLAEQERVAGIQKRIREIQAAATGHEKASSADLTKAIVAVSALDVSEAQYAEFSELAHDSKLSTLMTLKALHYLAVGREEREAAERAAEAERAEAERQCIAERERESQAQAMALLNAMPEAVDCGAIEPEQAERLSSIVASLAADSAITVAQVTADAAPAADAPAKRVITVELDDTPPPAIPAPLPEPTLTLGDLNAWLSPLKIDSAGLESLGFPAAGRRKAALLYHDTDKAAMVAAMVKHLRELMA